MKKKRIIEAALKARELSYSPYSKFKVGASVLLNDGTIVMGSNIENVSYGLSMCAERTALYTVYNKGYKKEDIKAIAVASDSNNFISPCGACRQVIIELVDKDCPIYLLNNKGEYKEVKVKDLLPFAFKEGDLNDI